MRKPINIAGRRRYKTIFMPLLRWLIFLIILSLFSYLVFNFFSRPRLKESRSGSQFEPAAGIANFAVDKEGNVRKSSNLSSLPQIIAQTEVLRGNEKLDGLEIKKALKIIIEFKKVKLDVKQIAVYNKERIDFLLENGIIVTVNSLVEEKQLVSSLQIMLPRFKIEGKMPKKIDYRFSKPIIVF